ncbi:MAG: DUF917 domain-containing protein [Thermoproteota archaeon]|nr:DUF917 domain-containing protein [Thermoproteota archaeon]
MRKLNHQDLLNLVDGAAIFSAGGGGDPDVGYEIVESLVKEGYTAKIVEPSEIPDNAKLINFAGVGATTTVAHDSQAAVKTFQTLENYVGRNAYAVIPVELGGFNTLAAVDVAARRGIPVVDADGAGRAVPEVHLKVYTIDNIPLTPMAVADVHAENMVIVKETSDARSAERIARTLAAEWKQSAYTARRILTGKQVKFSPILGTLSKSIRIGELLRKAANPIREVIRETSAFKLFEGKVFGVEKRTSRGFTWIKIVLDGTGSDEGSRFELKVKNEVLAAYRNGKLAAVAPDIVTPVHPETGKCITAEKIREERKLVVLGFVAPKKWRSRRGLELWKDVLQRSGVQEEYTPIEKLVHKEK